MTIHQPEVAVTKQPIKARIKARKYALQALYQWYMTQDAPSSIKAQFLTNYDPENFDSTYFSELLLGVVENKEAIDSQFAPFLDREINALNPIELCVLRLSSYELIYRFEIPYKIILDEGITLTKQFGSQDGHRYVNGVLNNLARVVRKIEIENE